MCLKCETIKVGTTEMREHAQSDATGLFLNNCNDEDVLVLHPIASSGQHWTGEQDAESRIQDPQTESHMGSHSHRGKVFPVTRKSRKFFSYCGSSTNSFSHCTVSSVVQLWTGRAETLKRQRWLVFWRTSGWCFNKKKQHRNKKNFNRVKNI